MSVAAKWLMGDTNEKLAVRYRGGRDRGPIERLSLGQGVFYLATGLWPNLNMRTFERITGPKTDKGLVKTAGVIITAIDVVYVTKGRISPAYLLDAVAELTLIGGEPARRSSYLKPAHKSVDRL